MQPEELLAEINRLKKIVASFVPVVKEGDVLKRIADIDQLSASDPNFWNKRESKNLLKEQSTYRKFLVEWGQLKGVMEDCEVLWELYKDGEESVLDELEKTVILLDSSSSQFELKLILNGEHDSSGAIVTIHSGAGGTESNDWASMLYRMYSRWAEQEDFKWELLDMQKEGEAGLKSVTFSISGDYAYGYMKGETGVHRLVRISPFDSQSRRHTSFASVFVLPEIDDSFDIDINEGDLRVDTYRAGGAGGQHVNTTDSAVRITHEPTGLVVTCQTERSQHQNKVHAMKILRSRLYEYEMNKRNNEKDKLEASKSEIGWGSQIRSYVMHPYKMVKDLRTRHETGNVGAVMDGELQDFIRAYLLFSAGILVPTGSVEDID